MNFGERLKKIRKEKKLSQNDVAIKMGVTQQTIAQYEKAENTPKYETIERLALALGVRISELLEPAVLQLNRDIIELFSGTGSVKFHADCTRINELYLQLNNKGQEKAEEYVEMLTQIPEYKEN